MRKASKACLFFFIFIYNYIFLRTTLFYSLYNYTKEFGFFIIIILLFLLLFIFLLIPSDFYNFNFYRKINKSKVKYLVSVFSILRGILGVGISSYILSTLFYKDVFFFFFIISSSILIYFLSLFKPSNLIEISWIFGFMLLILYLLYFHKLIPLEFSINGGFSYLIIPIIIVFILDNFLCLLSNKDNLEFSKLPIILGILISIILFLIEYGLLVFTSGTKLFQNNPFVGFIALRIAPVSRFYGSFDYIYIFSIGITSIFKLSFYQSLINSKKKYKVIISTIIMILAIGAYYLIKNNYIFYEYSIIIVGILSLIIIIYMIGVYYGFKKNKEYTNNYY